MVPLYSFIDVLKLMFKVMENKSNLQKILIVDDEKDVERYRPGASVPWRRDAEGEGVFRAAVVVAVERTDVQRVCAFV